MKTPKIFAAAAIAAGISGCDTLPRDPYALAATARNTTLATGLPPFQLVDQTNDKCMNRLALNALIFAFDDIDFDETCSDGERNKAALNNPAITGKERQFFKNLQKEQPLYLEPSIVSGGHNKGFSFHFLGVAGGGFYDTHITSLREGVARDVLSIPVHRPDMQALAVSMYAERNQESRERILKAAFYTSAALKSENKRFVRENVSSATAYAQTASVEEAAQSNCTQVGVVKGRKVFDCTMP